MTDGLEATRRTQARQALRWITAHPYATSDQICRAMGWTPAMWTQVRRYALEEAGAGRALVGMRATRSGYVWFVTDSAKAAFVDALERSRHIWTRRERLGRRDSVVLMSQSADPVIAGYGIAIMRDADAARGAREMAAGYEQYAQMMHDQYSEQAAAAQAEYASNPLFG